MQSMSEFDQLIIVGYWRSREEPHWPDSAWFVDPNWAPDLRTRVVEYLNSFEPVMCFAGLSWCRFRCKTRKVGSAEFTDGFWIWPEGRSHYVAKHQVRLPDEFASSVAEGRQPKKVNQNWWQEQRGWTDGESFDTPGFGGTLKLLRSRPNSPSEAIIYLRRTLKTYELGISELLDSLESGEAVILAENIDYCEVADMLSNARQLGLNLQFIEE